MVGPLQALPAFAVAARRPMTICSCTNKDFAHLSTEKNVTAHQSFLEKHTNDWQTHSHYPAGLVTFHNKRSGERNRSKRQSRFSNAYPDPKKEAL